MDGCARTLNQMRLPDLNADIHQCKRHDGGQGVEMTRCGSDVVIDERD